MRFPCILALLAVIAIPAAARAQNVDYFTITSEDGSNVVTFSLPSTFAADSPYSNVFYVDNVPVLDNGVAMLDTIGFFTTSFGGGFGDIIFGDPYSDSFFNDDTQNPIFTPGDYSFSDDPDGPTDGNVLITAGNSDTPEPSSLALFGTGVLGLAGVVRRRLRA